MVDLCVHSGYISINGKDARNNDDVVFTRAPNYTSHSLRQSHENLDTAPDPDE